MEEKFFKRTLFDEIEQYLSTNDIVVLHGARQVGKTSLLFYLKTYLQERGERAHYIDLEDSRYVTLLNGGVTAFLQHLEEEGFSLHELPKGKQLTVFIDEIQYLDNPSNFLKLIADHEKKVKLIVSGSSSFALKSKFKDSLVGRTINFELFPLSFVEFLTFRAYTFTPQLIRSRTLTQKKVDELRTLFIEYVLYGGYPKIVLTPNIAMKEKYLQQIIDTYIKKDIRDLAHVKDIEKFNKLIEALASQSGQRLNVVELSNTCKIAKQTVKHYLFILENTYILKRLRPYSRNIRSELFKTPKVFFYDTGIMQMLWLKGLQKEVLGTVFETAVFVELIKKYGGDQLYYWHTTDGKEVDFVLAKKGVLLPIEVKINFQQFTPTAMHYFTKKYGVKEYTVVGIHGERTEKAYQYPWML